MMHDKELGVSTSLHYEDPRYPTLILESAEFGVVGYNLNLQTGELHRICICSARCSGECVCGAWDSANKE
jgi:hypothetical protein